VSLILVGCGGSSSSTTEIQTASTGVGFYVDAAVKGAEYVCGSERGLTDAKGKFTFEVNENCTFKVGDIVLREVEANSLTNNMTVFEDNVTVAQFLQTIDRDGDASNGIDIPDSTKRVLSNRSITTIPNSNETLSSLQSDLDKEDETYNGRVVSEVETDRHLQGTRNEIAQNNETTQYSNVTTKTKAYFGDKVNNRVVVVDVDNMKLIDAISTGHEVSYAAEVIKTKATEHKPNPKLYVDNRGSNAIDVFDSATNTITKSIALDFYPRSITVQEETGLVAVSGTNKAMVAIIDSKTDVVIATVGKDLVTQPTTSGHSYVSSGTLASGHPHWLNENHFVVIDRQNKQIDTYKLTKNSDGTWVTSLVNELVTPSPVHDLIPPKVHGQGHTNQNSTIFYATAEGATDIYPSVLKLTFTAGVGLTLNEELPLKASGYTANEMGVHHLNFLKDKKSIYVGSHEGTLFVVDYSTSPMNIVKMEKAGIGAGHADEMKHNNLAVIINHKDTFITIMNTLTHTKVADIKVSNLTSITGQTQSHPQYHFSKDGRYFYLFLTQEGALVKVDLTKNEVVERLEIGGELAMGSFVSNKKEGSENTNHNGNNENSNNNSSNGNGGNHN
jgi:YVTN family beta-propeller protein